MDRPAHRDGVEIVAARPLRIHRAVDANETMLTSGWCTVYLPDRLPKTPDGIELRLSGSLAREVRRCLLENAMRTLESFVIGDL